MKDTIYTRDKKRVENFVPTELHDFLIALEATNSSQNVWELLVAFSQNLNLPVVDYVCASDYRNWEQAQFIQSTFHSRWIKEAQNNPEIRKTSYFRSHAVNFLTPIVVGLAYIDEFDDITPGRRAIMELGCEMGLNAGFAIPLRMNEPGEAGIIIFGGPQSRDEFNQIVRRHGWAMNSAALMAHTHYIQFFRAEFVNRNHLTDKQKEILRHIGGGLLDKQIANELCISISAVRQRITSVHAKTGAQNRADLAALAMRLGLLPDPTLKSHRDILTVFLSTGDGKTGLEIIQNHRSATSSTSQTSNRNQPNKRP